MTDLTATHFARAWKGLAGLYGRQTDALGCSMAFAALKAAAPHMPAEAFDFGVAQAMLRCRFMPSLAEVLLAVFEPDESSLPALPDIDPAFADSYQLGIYQRAQAERLKALQSAPPDTSRYRPDCQAALVAAGVLVEQPPGLPPGWRAVPNQSLVGRDPSGRVSPVVDLSAPPTPGPSFNDRVPRRADAPPAAVGGVLQSLFES